jgi:shikimate dehydrogenase
VTSSFSPTGSTRVAAVIGDPVHHSLSPVLHNAAFRELGLDWVYVALPVQATDGSNIVAAMKTFGISGLSVTMPHKQAAMSGADSISDDVALLRASNTLTRSDDGHVRAHTTDGDGCIDALRAEGFDPLGKKCLVLGAGGAGRAVILALARAGATEIVVVNRDADRATSAVGLVTDAGGVGSVGNLDDARRCDLVVNATSIGMAGTPGGDESLPISAEYLHAGQHVLDLVYQPLDTALLKAARQIGAKPIDGLGMLLHQAGRQFSLWTNHPAPIACMRDALTAELQSRRKSQP